MAALKQQLTAMFPDLSQDVLDAVMQQHKGNEAATIDALLALNNTTAGKNESLLDLIKKVERMADGRTNARQLAGKFGLDVMSVAWEDNGRFKGSCWGPCISDMTLNVLDHALPLVRHPNFEDLTWDVPMEKIPLVVGNEIKGGQLYTVTLKEYLENFRLYLHNPQSWKGSKTSLYAAERDSHALMSSQACFLPVPKGSDATFNVSIFNYQSYSGHPAVLAIVATRKGILTSSYSQGTSAQVVQDGSQKLYFNKSGEKASFIGQRLTDNRKERGVATEGEMTKEEKQQNMIMVIQVPLKQAEQPRTHTFFSPPMMCSTAAPMYQKQCMNFPEAYACQEEEEAADVEDAIVKVGEAEGSFDEVAGIAIERDPQFPVRVTLQFYKSTANGVADEEAMRTIAAQIESSRKFADNIGSLVVGGRTDRPTEHSVPSPAAQPIFVPAWWSTFWLTYGRTLPQLNEEQAKTLTFGHGGAAKWGQSTMQGSQHEVLATLRGHAQPALPDWNVLG